MIQVFPVVGEHCEINLHWDGVNLSSLHVRSIVPENYVLVSRTTASNGHVQGRVSSSGNLEREQSARASPPPNITIKEEPIDINDELIVVHDPEIKQEVNVEDDASSDEAKYDSNEHLISNQPNATGGASCSIHDKQYSSNAFRPKPPEPSAAAPPYSMYFPQNSMIPMIPLMAFGQSQLPYPQVAPMLFSPMQSLPQMPLHGMIPQMVPGYNPYLHSPFNMQPVSFSQFSQSLQNEAATDANVLLQRSSRFI